MRINLIIPAAGMSSRARTAENKIFIKAADGRSVIEHSVGAFLDFQNITKIIIASKKDDEPRLSTMFKNQKTISVVEGGACRAESVKNALAAVETDCDIVLIHDAARPYVSKDLIAAVIADTELYGSSVPYTDIIDTLKFIDGDGKISTVDRKKYAAVSTAQGFLKDDILAAYSKIPASDYKKYTDDSSVYESATGKNIRLTKCLLDNSKITDERDIERFKSYNPNPANTLVDIALDPIRRGLSTTSFRIGSGYDFHGFGGEKPLVLGGVRIDGARGLSLIGHSDADVLTHAVMDALLSSVSEKDIGQLFPDGDPQYEGISSLLLLKKVRLILEARSASVINISCVIVCDEPKIAPLKSEIKAALAAVLGIDPSRISVAGKTDENLTSYGIAVHSVCLISLSPNV